MLLFIIYLFTYFLFKLYSLYGSKSLSKLLSQSEDSSQSHSFPFSFASSSALQYKLLVFCPRHSLIVFFSGKLVLLYDAHQYCKYYSDCRSLPLVPRKTKHFTKCCAHHNNSYSKRKASLKFISNDSYFASIYAV